MHCDSCNEASGYQMREGQCYLSKCLSGFYFNIFTNKCNRCHPSCKECYGQSSDQCLDCNSGLLLKNTMCMTCEAYDSRLQTFLEDYQRSCTEVCGDGFNMKFKECDDGNTDDGDGCSSSCNVENEFKCQGGNEVSPDICIRTKVPVFSLFSVSSSNTIVIIANYPIKISSEKQISDIFHLSISGPQNEFEFSYQISTVLKPSYSSSFELNILEVKSIYFNEVTFNLNILETIIGFKNEKCVITFYSTDLIDSFGNNIQELPIEAYLNPVEYIFMKQEASINAATTSLEISTLIIFGANIFLQQIYGNSINSMWSLVHFLQLMNIISLLNIKIPDILQNFMANLEFCNADFPYLQDLFTSCFFFDLPKFPFNLNFEKNGYSSKWVLVNYSGQLSLWVGYFLAYPIIAIIVRRKKWDWLVKLYHSYKYNGTITALNECYALFSVLAFINIWSLSFNSFFELFCSIIGILSMLGVCAYPILILSLLSNNRKIMNKSSFKKKFGSLYTSYYYKSEISQSYLYIFIFLMKRLFLAVSITFLDSIPVLQLVTIQFINFFYLFWIIEQKPFRDQDALILEIISEAIQFLIAILFWFFLGSNQLYHNIGGSLCIALIALNIMIHIGWYAYSLYSKIKNSIKKRKSSVFRKSISFESQFHN